MSSALEQRLENTCRRVAHSHLVMSCQRRSAFADLAKATATSIATSTRAERRFRELGDG